MTLRHFPLLVIITLILAVCALGQAALAGADPWEGAYAGDDMKLMLSAGPQGYSGQIVLGGKTYPLMAQPNGQTLRGEFMSGEERFPCTMAMRDGRLIFTTGSSSYTLQRAGKGSNPLERDGGGAGGNAGGNVGGNVGGGAVGGVGIALDRTNQDGRLRIAAVKPGGPAEEAGIQPGDILLAVNDQKVDGMKLDQVGGLLRGEIGSMVKISTLTLSAGGGRAEATRQVVRADMSAPASPREANQREANQREANPREGDPRGGMAGDERRSAGATYQHQSGMYSIAKPLQDGWKFEESPDGNTARWTHPSGAMIFVTLVPQCGFDSGEAFFKKAIAQGLQQSGAQVMGERPLQGAGAPGHVAWFRRQRNGVGETGQSTVAVVNGTGVIFQMLLPDEKGQEFNQSYNEIATSFKLNVR